MNGSRRKTRLGKIMGICRLEFWGFFCRAFGEVGFGGRREEFEEWV